MSALAAVTGPKIDWAGLSPLLALLGGATVVLLLGLLRAPIVRRVLVPGGSALTLLAALAACVWQWDEDKLLIAGALRVDDLVLLLSGIFIVTGLATVAISLRTAAAEQAGQGEYHALLLYSVAGMVVLVAAENLVTLFLGLELLSIALYVLCATELRRATSLESGLKYLIVGSVGSATLLYGLALIYGATGATDYLAIARAIADRDLATNALLLTGIALVVGGLCFKASVAPFHQWTPDVYEGAPTPITSFMAVATKAAAFGVILRLFDIALIDAQPSWGPALAALAAFTMIVGNVGALGQSSLKRMLAYSGVGQAGYLLVGVVVGTQLGVRATVFYLAVYLTMNVAAFAVIAARERETGAGDHLVSVAGLGAARPLLAWPMTIAMLSLAGLPLTAGFIGKLQLIRAAVDGGYAWLGVVLVVGSMISLGYYLRVVATIWMRDAPALHRVDTGRPAARAAGARPVIAGGSPEADVAGAGDGEAHAGDGDDVGARAATATETTEGHPAVPGSYLVRGTSARDRLQEPGDAVPVRSGREPLAMPVAVLFGAASLVIGVVPGPLFDLARDAGRALGGLL